MSAITEGQRILNEEAAALTHLASRLDDTFSDTVDTIVSCSGRVIISGMGKSGHIGAKIAATLASTGTPAFFVHPGEASHGDLGMIAENDVVIALSHSGESKELADIIGYCTRFKIPLIALTGKPKSTLGKAATHVLLNHVTKEACPLNMAPMSSTTATLALGDALAAALMQAKGFQKEDFGRYHPGGKLGAQLLSAAEIMATTPLPTLPTNANMPDILVQLTEVNLGCVCFVENEKLMGIFTDGDVKRHMDEHIMQKTGTDVMTANPISIMPETLASKAVALMQEKNITVLPVVENGTLVGILQMQHCLQHGVV